MAYDRDYGRDNRSSYRNDNDRWREQGGASSQRYSDDRDRMNRGPQQQQHGDERGFFDRAGDEVRSWFGDEEAERRRERDSRMDDRHDDRQRQGSYGTSTGYGAGSRGYYGSDRTSTSRYAAGQGGGGGSGGGWSSGGRGRDDDDHRYGEYGVSGAHYESDYRQRDYGRSNQGEHRYSEPSSYGQSSQGGGWGGQHQQHQQQQGHHDQNYSRWRDQQMQSLDRDYDEYHREKQSAFDQEFGAWRNKRQGQRQSMGRVSEHMDVVGSDGEHVGTVDKVRGDRIILTKNDADAGGRHHSIPCSWIESVDDKVTINKSADEAHRAWRDEEDRQAMFGGGRDQEQGPHMLNRSFSGTYDR